MKLFSTCLNELADHDLFENLEHRDRFSELLHCYGRYPFFSKGLCKCMYLSSWDIEHFIILVETLNHMTIDSGMDIEEMKTQGKVMEKKSSGYDPFIMRLSEDFLNGVPYEFPDVEIPADGLYIIRRALEMSDVVDQVFGEFGL